MQFEYTSPPTQKQWDYGAFAEVTGEWTYHLTNTTIGDCSIETVTDDKGSFQCSGGFQPDLAYGIGCNTTDGEVGDFFVMPVGAHATGLGIGVLCQVWGLMSKRNSHFIPLHARQ